MTLTWLRPALLLVLSLLLGCTPAQRVSPAPTPGNVPPSARPSIDPATLARAIHARVNEERLQHGLAALAWSDTLAAIAYAHSRDMARRSYFAHENRKGQTATERAAQQGFSCRKEYGDYFSEGVGENLFFTGLYRSYREIRRGRDVQREYNWKTLDAVTEEVVRGWLDSPGHRRNLLEPRYDAEGVGVVLAADERIYVTQNFC